MKNEKIRQSIFSKKLFTAGRNSVWPILVSCSFLILPVFFISCEYENKPAPYNPAAIENTGKPIITGIAPAAQAVAGIREITITGTGLEIKNGTDTNWVFIGGTRPLIKDIQNTSITVYRPALANDRYDKPITVSVTDTKMLTVSSSIEYLVELPGAIVGDYSASFDTIKAIEFDNKTTQENIYLGMPRRIDKNDFAGVTPVQLMNTSTTEFRFISDISFGPGARQTYLGKPSGRELFIVTGRNSVVHLPIIDTNINMRSPMPIRITLPSAVDKMDFDENGDLYAGGSGGIYWIGTSIAADTVARTVSQAPNLDYQGLSIKQIKIFKLGNKKYIYVADPMNIWRSELLGGGVFGSKELLVTLNGTIYEQSNRINSIAIDVNGMIFLCLTNHPKYSLFIVETDGSITPYYTDSSILPNTIEFIKWGNGNYLYLVSGSLRQAGALAAGRIYRLTLDRTGAPCYGRTFIK